MTELLLCGLLLLLTSNGLLNLRHVEAELRLGLDFVTAGARKAVCG